MLIDVINENLIELDVEVNDWKEAIEHGGNLLVKEGVVKQSYVEAMVQSVLDIGPYVVLDEGIALPHAKPETGALKIGVSIMTLKNPVVFGHPEHDPVKLVICLAAVDSTSHLQVLSGISQILDGGETMDKILACKTKQEVLDIIKTI